MFVYILHPISKGEEYYPHRNGYTLSCGISLGPTLTYIAIFCRKIAHFHVTLLPTQKINIRPKSKIYNNKISENYAEKNGLTEDLKKQ